jgi:hypothetical protein
MRTRPSERKVAVPERATLIEPVALKPGADVGKVVGVGAMELVKLGNVGVGIGLAAPGPRL